MTKKSQPLQKFFKSLALVISLITSSASSSLAGAVRITNYGHSSFLIKGGGQSVLINPFKAVGCAAGLKEPAVKVDVILASSNLADEGARIAQGIFLVNPGSYRFGKLKLEGFAAPQDRFGGRRYGFATVWQWEQGGLNFAHLGGIASPLTEEDKIILGRPDVLFIGVGGGAKSYNGEEATRIIKELNPKQVFPVKYNNGDKKSECDLTGIQPFLNSMQGIEVRNVGKTISLKSKLSNQMIINIMEY